MVPQALKGHERPEEVTGAQDLEPIRIKEGPLLQPTAPPILHEETPEIVEKSPIGADLGPRSPESYSSSIVPYEDVQGKRRRKDVSAHQDELPSGEDVHMEETELPEAERRT